MHTDLLLFMLILTLLTLPVILIVAVISLIVAFKINNKAKKILSKLDNTKEEKIKPESLELNKNAQVAENSEIPAQVPENSEIPAQVAEKVAQSSREPVKSDNKVLIILEHIFNWILFGLETRNPEISLEYAIGSTWIIRLPIIIFVTGVGFILKYSIDNALLGPIGRVSLSFLLGIVLLFLGIKLIKGKYSVIAQSLLGGAIAVFYFSSFASSAMYKLIDIKFAFALMIFVTIISGLLAIKLNSLLVAILGVLGGYLTPIMLSTGSNNIFGLFSYMFLLGTGVLFIARFKSWKLLNLLSFIANYTIFIMALEECYNRNIHFTIALTFSVLFFILFSGITILNNIIKKEKVTILALGGMFSNVSIFFLTTSFLINELYPREYIAFVSLGLVVFYVSGVAIFIKQKIYDKALLIFMISFASFFLTITIPLLLSNEFLASAWAILAFLLLWMSAKLKNKFLRKVAFVVYAITFARLFIYDLKNDFIAINSINYFDEMFARFMSFGFLILSSSLGYKLLKRESNNENDLIENVSDIQKCGPQTATVSVFIYISSILTFIYLHFELFYVFDAFYKPFIIPGITFIWLATTIILLFKFKTTNKTRLINWVCVLFVGLILKSLIFDLYNLHFNLDLFRFNEEYSIENLGKRMMNFIPIIAMTIYAYLIIIKEKVVISKLFAISAIIITFLYLSAELNTALDYFIPQFRPGGISILWGVFAISFIFFGIQKKITSLRYSGLILFAICSIKVFVYDLTRLNSLYRIVTFITLGIIFLTGAFIFVKHKDSFLSNNKGEKDED